MKSILIALALILPASAQSPNVSIFEQSRNGLRAEEKRIAKQAEKLFEDGKLLGLEATGELIKSPPAAKLKLPAALQTALTPTQIATRAKASGYRVGWAYLCNNCDNWHINLAGGYALTTDGVLGTCAHVIKMDNKKMRKGGLIAVDHSGKVFPVTSILANDNKIDGALIKIDAKTIPLPLNDQVSPGDSAFCLSRPLKQGQYFSQGMVNRFYWDSDQRGDDPNSIKALGALKLNVSTRWAPGSSGSAVLDTFGNVIGHVATISTMGNGGSRKDNDKGRTLITLHSATPARAMMALARLPEDSD
ncbi:serine protease [Akkermansiaceae bacterium]|nr:serine protease [Akkermansiaceae bacterium]MDA7930217.1 serine protease [Akkermansiaceae bacterium]MDB4680322.1 serine protease [Akkermansiaceae bacterium]